MFIITLIYSISIVMKNNIYNFQVQTQLKITRLFYLKAKTNYHFSMRLISQIYILLTKLQIVVILSFPTHSKTIRMHSQTLMMFSDIFGRRNKYITHLSLQKHHSKTIHGNISRIATENIFCDSEELSFQNLSIIRHCFTPFNKTDLHTKMFAILFK